MKGFPLEYGIGARGSDCFYDGLPDGRKSFKIGLVVLIQYRITGCDRQPPSQPPTHVAVGNTHYAIASRLKWLWTCHSGPSVFVSSWSTNITRV